LKLTTKLPVIPGPASSFDQQKNLQSTKTYMLYCCSPAFQEMVHPAQCGNIRALGQVHGGILSIQTTLPGSFMEIHGWWSCPSRTIWDSILETNSEKDGI
jgi:hypothetical protein